MPINRPLLILLITALTGMLLGVSLPSIGSFRPSAPLHIIFALGVMPLIMGAMVYFVPVLTRTQNPLSGALAPAAVGVVTGIVLVFSLLLAFQLFPIAALLGLTASLWLSVWIYQRRDSMLGQPHPGLIWYQIALVALALGLISILCAAIWPEQWQPLKYLHIHLNLLGFIGLTALGTLRVLLPTAGAYPDTDAGNWLNSQWRPLASGTLLIAVGAAWYPTIALLGAILWLYPLTLFSIGILTRHRTAIWHLHGAPPPLATATIVLFCIILSGVTHTLGWTTSGLSTQLFTHAFLPSLITGAATHLIPLWVAPGNQRTRQQRLGQHLGHLSLIRSMLFLLAGGIALPCPELALIPTLLGMAHFAFLLTGLPRLIRTC